MALVNYERDGQIVTLTLNRPEKLNAFSDELVGALGDALHRFDTDDEAQIAILCGTRPRLLERRRRPAAPAAQPRGIPQARRAAGPRHAFRPTC